MLLLGEGALVYKIFDWSSSDNEEKTEIVVSNDNRSLKESVTKQVKERVSKEVSNTGNVSATVKNIYVDHNVEEEGVKGMQIEVEFESKNLKGEALYCMVRFYNDDGSPLAQKTNNEKYRSINGNVKPEQLYSFRTKNYPKTQMEVLILFWMQVFCIIQQVQITKCLTEVRRIFFI